MATVSVQTTPGYNQFNRNRYMQLEAAYGTIPSSDYSAGDTLSLVDLPAKQIVHGKFVTADGDTLEVFNSTDLSSALSWAITTAPADISYYILYIEGSPSVNLKVTVTQSP